MTIPIKPETIYIDGREYEYFYSVNKKYIIQVETGGKYEDAIDIPHTHTYIESDEDIPEEEPEE